MHNFSELIDNMTHFTLSFLNNLETKTAQALETSSATQLVKKLQMIQLEKIVIIVGIFSFFEAILQNRLNCTNGFKEAKKVLQNNNEPELLSRFIDLELAINSLKHGKGRSYNKLISKNGESLKFKIKHPENNHFHEGDVSEVTALIDVDDDFIFGCVKTIKQVSEKIEKLHPESCL